MGGVGGGNEIVGTAVETDFTNKGYVCLSLEAASNQKEAPVLEIELEEEGRGEVVSELRKIIEQGTGKVFLFKYWTSSMMEENFTKICNRFNLSIPKVFAPAGVRGGAVVKRGLAIAEHLSDTEVRELLDTVADFPELYLMSTRELTASNTCKERGSTVFSVALERDQARPKLHIQLLKEKLIGPQGERPQAILTSNKIRFSTKKKITVEEVVAICAEINAVKLRPSNRTTTVFSKVIMDSITTTLPNRGLGGGTAHRQVAPTNHYADTVYILRGFPKLLQAGTLKKFLNEWGVAQQDSIKLTWFLDQDETFAIQLSTANMAAVESLHKLPVQPGELGLTASKWNGRMQSDLVYLYTVGTKREMDDKVQVPAHKHAPGWDLMRKDLNIVIGNKRQRKQGEEEKGKKQNHQDREGKKEEEWTIVGKKKDSVQIQPQATAAQPDTDGQAQVRERKGPEKSKLYKPPVSARAANQSTLDGKAGQLVLSGTSKFNTLSSEDDEDIEKKMGEMEVGEDEEEASGSDAERQKEEEEKKARKRAEEEEKRKMKNEEAKKQYKKTKSKVLRFLQQGGQTRAHAAALVDNFIKIRTESKLGYVEYVHDLELLLSQPVAQAVQALSGVTGEESTGRGSRKRGRKGSSTTVTGETEKEIETTGDGQERMEDEGEEKEEKSGEDRHEKKSKGKEEKEEKEEGGGGGEEKNKHIGSKENANSSTQSENDVQQPAQT